MPTRGRVAPKLACVCNILLAAQLFDKLQFVSVIKRNITHMIRYRAPKKYLGPVDLYSELKAELK